MKWKVGEAKQQLSEVLRQSATEPQLVYSRDKFVAAIISPDLFKELQRWRDERRGRTLGQAFSELREVCSSEGYALEVSERRDRESWVTDEDDVG